MQKGRSFEKQIEKVMDHINSTGGHAHKNYAKRLEDGTYIQGEPFDYEAFIKNYHCVFDAKECKENIWYMKEKDIKQAENLKHCKNAGLDAYFLILFESKEIRQIDIDVVIEVLKQNKKGINKKMGREWELLKKIGGVINGI